MAQGPGAGPEVMQGVGAAAQALGNENTTLKGLLSSLAASPLAGQGIRDLAQNAGA